MWHGLELDLLDPSTRPLRLSFSSRWMLLWTPAVAEGPASAEANDLFVTFTSAHRNMAKRNKCCSVNNAFAGQKPNPTNRICYLLPSKSVPRWTRRQPQIRLSFSGCWQTKLQNQGNGWKIAVFFMVSDFVLFKCIWWSRKISWSAKPVNKRSLRIIQLCYTATCK